MKEIGIKLGDGTFCKVLEDNKEGSRILLISPVSNGQSNCTLDFYRTGEGKIEGAKYVDSVKIANIPPYDKDDCTIYLTVSLDKDNKLNFAVNDPKARSSSAIVSYMLKRSELERKNAPNFNLLDIRDKVTGLGLLARAIAKKDRQTIDVERTLYNEPLPQPSKPLPQPAPIPPAPPPVVKEEVKKEEKTAETLPDLSDFSTPITPSSTPIIKEEVKKEEKEEQDSSMYDLPDLDTAPVSSASYEESEKEEEQYNEEIEETRSKAPLIICLVIVMLALIAVLLLLFILPTKFNLYYKMTQDKSAVVEEEKTPAEKEEGIWEVEEENVTEGEPILPTKDEAEEARRLKEEEELKARENEIVVVKQAETVKKVVPVPPPAPKVKVPDTIYKIKWGDTLWDIAETYYKNPWKYKMIARYNSIRDPDYIISGHKIALPAK